MSDALKSSVMRLPPVAVAVSSPGDAAAAAPGRTSDVAIRTRPTPAAARRGRGWDRVSAPLLPSVTKQTQPRLRQNRVAGDRPRDQPLALGDLGLGRRDPATGGDAPAA